MTAHALRAADAEHLAVVLARGHLGHQLVHVRQVLREAHQRDLEEAVVQRDQVLVQLHQPGHGGGVGHAAEDEVALQRLAVQLHARLVVRQLGQAVDALQQVGKVAQGLLGLLRGLVADVGEGAEGGDIGEIAARAHVAHVPGARRALHHAAGGGGGVVLRQAQRGGHVVGRAQGEVAQRRALPFRHAHQARHHVREGAVPAQAAERVVVRAALRGQVHGLARAGGEPHRGHIARGVEDVQRFAQALAVHAAAGHGVDDDKKAFRFQDEHLAVCDRAARDECKVRD